jgi:hypothetical protein
VLVSPPASSFDSNVAYETGVGLVAVAGDYAALVNESGDQYGDTANTVVVFDLRTGAAVADRGDESADCPSPGGGYCAIAQLVLGTDGVTAALTVVHSVEQNVAVEQIVANDSTGTHILDSISFPGSLSALDLSADTLTWSHNGTSESAQLN